MNGRFLMSKYSNDGHKLNHEILSPCTKEMVRVNLASPSRSKCLLTWAPEETTYPAFCGDGVIQGQRSKFWKCLINLQWFSDNICMYGTEYQVN